MKKKLIALALVAICLAILAGGTLAYYSRSVTAHNVITTGGVHIELIEKGENGEDFQNVSGVMPGRNVIKETYVKNKTNSAEAWVRMDFRMEIMDADGNPIVLGPDEDLPFTPVYNEDDWTYDQTDGCYYYNEPLSPGEESTVCLRMLDFSEDMDNRYQGCKVNVYVSAQAVQTANNGKTASEAEGWPTAGNQN